MNTEELTDLVWKSQMGDEAAMEQLLLRVYAPIFYLAEKILQDEDTAAQVTREVLETICGKLNSLGDPDQFQKWMCRVTAARCMQAMPLFHQSGVESKVPALWQETLSDSEVLTETQSAQVIQQMVDTLPKNQRLCILLLGCGGLNISAIAQLTGFSEASVKEHIQQGQNTIQRYLWELQGRDIQLSGLTSLTGILRTAMFSARDSENAMAVVYGVLGREVPVPPDPEKGIIRVLVIVLALLLVGVIAAGAILIRLMTSRPQETEPLFTTAETTLATTESTTVPTETTQPTEVTTEPTAAETTAETLAPTTAPAVPETTEAVQPVTPPATTESQTPADAPAKGDDGHTHQYSEVRSIWDCENGGSKTYQCSVCSYTYDEKVAALGSHTFKTVLPGSNPTCTKAGTMTKLCSVCSRGYPSDDPAKPALGHDYVANIVVAPTATSQGYTSYRCSRCSDSYDADFVDPLPSTTQPPVADPSATETPDPTA